MMNLGAADFTVSPSLPTLCSSRHRHQEVATADTKAADRVPLPPPVPPPPPNSDLRSGERALAYRNENIEASFKICTEKKTALQRVEKDDLTEYSCSEAINNADSIPSAATGFTQEHTLQNVSSFRHADFSSFVAVSTAPDPEKVRGLLAGRSPSSSAFTDLRTGTQLRAQEKCELVLDNNHVKNELLMTVDYGWSPNDHSLPSSIALSHGTTAKECFCVDSFIPSSHALDNCSEKHRCVDFRFKSGDKEYNLVNQSDANHVQCPVLKNLCEKNSVDSCKNSSSFVTATPLSSLPCGSPTNCVEGRRASSRVETMAFTEDRIPSHAMAHENRVVMEGPLLVPSTNCSPMSPHLPLSSGLPGQGSQDSGIASCEPSEEEMSLPHLNNHRLTMAAVGGSSRDSCQWLGSLEYDAAASDPATISQSFTSQQPGSYFYSGSESTSVKGSPDTKPNLEASCDFDSESKITSSDKSSSKEHCGILCGVESSRSVGFINDVDTESKFSDEEIVCEVNETNFGFDKQCLEQDHLNIVESLERKNVRERSETVSLVMFERKDSSANLGVSGYQNDSYSSNVSPHLACLNSQTGLAQQCTFTKKQERNLCKACDNLFTFGCREKCIGVDVNSTSRVVTEPSNFPSPEIARKSVELPKPALVLKPYSINFHHKYLPVQRTSSATNHGALCCATVDHKFINRYPRNGHAYAKSCICSHIFEYASFLTEKIVGQALKEIVFPQNDTFEEIPHECNDKTVSLSINLSASCIAYVHPDLDSSFGQVPIESGRFLTRNLIENAFRKQVSTLTIDLGCDRRKYTGKSLISHDPLTQRSLSDTELLTADDTRGFDMNCPFGIDENSGIHCASDEDTSPRIECDNFNFRHTLECYDAFPQIVPTSSQSHYSFTPRKDGTPLQPSSPASLEPSCSTIFNSHAAASPLVNESINVSTCQSFIRNCSAMLVPERHYSGSEISSPEERVEGQQDVRPSDDMEDDSRSSAIGRPACFSRDTKRARESGDDEDYYPRELSTSEYGDRPSRKPARTNKPSTELYSSQKIKRRIRTRRRSSAGRNRASKTLQESRVGRRSSRSAIPAADPGEVYSQPVDSIAEATVLQPRVVIASQPRRLTHRKHRITSSALTVALPLLNSSTIAGSKNVPLKSSGSESFARPALSRLSSPKKGTKEKKNSRKFLCRKIQKSLVTCETVEAVPSKESIVCNVGSAHRTSLLSSSDLPPQSNLLKKSEVCNGETTPDREYTNGQKSSKRLSRKDKHEHRNLCRLLPFVGMRWCQRKDDHSSESREEAYVASAPVTALTGEDKKRGLFSTIRNGLSSLFSFGSDKNGGTATITAQANVSSNHGTSASVAHCVTPTTLASPHLPPTPSDLLNHSNYSAFTRAPARLPLHEPLSNRVGNDFAGPILPSNDRVDKETLEVLAGDAIVSPALPLISSSTAVQGDLGCRSPVGLLNQRALPPLPKSDDSASPHPPIPPPLPQAMLSAIAVASNQSGLDSEAVEGPLPHRDSVAHVTAAGVAKVDGVEEDGCHFASMIEKVKDYGWYWGPISGKAAEKIVSNEPDGSFIVRDSSDDHYIFSLTFKLNGLTRHVRIEHDQGNFSFGGYTKFKSQTIVEFIESAIEHSRSGRYLFFLHRRPLLGPRRVQLLHPVSRYRHVQSLQHLCRFVIVKNVRRDRLELLPLPGRLLHYLSSPHYYSELVDQLMAEEEEEEEGQKETLETTIHDNDVGTEGVNGSSAPHELEIDTGVPVGSGSTDSAGDGVPTESEVPDSEQKERGTRTNDDSSRCSPNVDQDMMSDSVIIPELDDPEDEIGVICNPFECSAVVEALHPFDQSSSSASLSNDVHEFCFVHCQDKEQLSSDKPLPSESPALQAKCSCATSGKNAQFNISSFCNRCIVHSPRSICVGGHRLPVEHNRSEEIVLDHQSEACGNSEKREICTSLSFDASQSSSSDTARQTAGCDEGQSKIASKLTKPVKRRPLSMSSLLYGVPKSSNAPRKVGKIVSYHVDLNSDGPTLIKFTKLLDASGTEFCNLQSQETNYNADNLLTHASNCEQAIGHNNDCSTRATGGECLRMSAEEGNVDDTYFRDRSACTEEKSGLSPHSAGAASRDGDCYCNDRTVSEHDLNTTYKGVLPATPVLSVIAKSSLEELGTF